MRIPRRVGAPPSTHLGRHYPVGSKFSAARASSPVDLHVFGNYSARTSARTVTRSKALKIPKLQIARMIPCPVSYPVLA